MQDHPSRAASDDHTPVTGSAEYRVQRSVLLELVTSSPVEGSEINQLAFAVDELRTDVAAAIGALVNVGLAERNGQRLCATPAALRFDALWSVRS